LKIRPNFFSFLPPFGLLGGLDYDAATQFIGKRFLGMNENPKKLLYIHFTCATDTHNIGIVFKAVKDIVLRQGLQTMGIME
jgi:hypothetical protein